MRDRTNMQRHSHLASLCLGALPFCRWPLRGLEPAPRASIDQTHNEQHLLLCLPLLGRQLDRPALLPGDLGTGGNETQIRW